MDAFNFCWVTLLRESKKCSVFFDKDTCNVRNDIDENFDMPIKRISYLYKFGGYNISFFHQCFKEFVTKIPDSSKIIDNFRSIKNLIVCSMSAGPGTDIIGFLYSLHQINKPLMNSAAFKVIDKHSSWGNIVTEMMNSSFMRVPEQTICNFTACDFLKDLSKKAQRYLKAADILLMCDSFSSSVSPEIISDVLQKVIHLLKSGALVFFIFDKEKSAYCKELESSGTFLFGPVEVALEDMPYDEKVAELVGVKPVCSGSSLFSVWQKVSETQCEIFQKQTEVNLVVGSNQHSSTKLTLSKSDVKDSDSPILNTSSLIREFPSNSNISSGNSFGKSSQFSSCSISSQIIKKDKPVVPDNSVNFNVQNIGFSEMHLNSSARIISSASSNASDPFEGKNCISLCGSDQRKMENKGNDMNSVLKHFENLITKFERLISSQDSLKNSHDKDNQSSSGQQYHPNLCQGHLRCCVKPCQLTRSACCCHPMMHYNDTNVCNHSCSSSVASNLYRNLPQNGPCIVIPLQNLSNESLTHILSIVSKNCCSVNKTSSTLHLNEEKN